MKVAVGLAPLLLLFTGCLSSRMVTMPATLSEVRSRDIRETLDARNYLKALQDIEYLARRDGPDVQPDELSGYRKQALEGVTKAFESSISSADFLAAYRLYLSLESLGEAGRFPAWSAPRIVESLIRERAKAGDTVSASLYLARASDEGLLSRSQVDALASAFGSEEGRRLYEQIRSGTFDAQPTPQMLKGTAIIWVDKGIRFQGGVGLPDRVMGSGFFIDKEGHLLTNYHVVQSEVDPSYEGYSRLYVRLPRRSDERIPAKVVAWDPVFDLALLKTEVTPDYVFPVFGDPKVAAGDKVFAIGSPVDPFLQNTVTSGIVSATGRRRLLQMGDVIQVDAAVNPGNSGGPLLSEKGELLGVVFAGIKPFEGLNFAIPQHWIRKVLPALMRGGEVFHPWLGMALMESEHGLQVIYTVPGAPADRAGIAAGDVLVSLNGRSFKSIRDLQDYLLDLEPDTLVRVSWQRSGEGEGQPGLVHGLVQLQKRPKSPIELSLQRDARINVLPALFGLRIEPAGGFLWESEYTVTQIVPGSVADNTGLSEGDVLSVQMWRVDTEQRYALLQIFVKKRKSGYLERVIQLAAYLDPDNFV